MNGKEDWQMGLGGYREKTENPGGRRIKQSAQEAIERQNGEASDDFPGAFHGGGRCRGGRDGRRRAVEVFSALRVQAGSRWR